MALPYLTRARAKSPISSCLNNLHEIGVAYRHWSADGGDKLQAETPVDNGGWKDLLTNADQGPNCWTNYALMSNELGSSPKLLICPADERRPAKDFKTDFKDNSHLSYFVGVSADDYHPESILGGDRNLGLGTKPDSDYGLSPQKRKGK
jgi:hypothetical protein